MTITNITERERELSARVATDAEIMAGLATMSQNYALKAKGFEEQLEIAQGTLKNLWARVAELEAELEKAAIENKALTESAMMQREFKEPDDVEFGLIEQAATASFMKHQRSVKGQQITRSDSYETHLVWAAKAFYAGAQPVPEDTNLNCKWPTCHSTDYQDELCKSLIDGRIDVPKGWQIVRVEPTPEMIDATGATMPDMREMVVADYKAMLAAAKETK